MKGKDQKYFAVNLLLALNTFALFLIVFENRLSLPVWLTPLGRLHPILLHFPIAIILIALLLEFLSITNRIGKERGTQQLIKYSFFLGALSSVITVIMGVFLSKEGGYGESSLLWHKWSGMGVAIITFIIFSFRGNLWFTGMVARSALLFTAVSILVTGHFGGILTHGENFVLAPLDNDEPAIKKFDEALVYDDLIQPVLEARCNSCHNSNKKRGRLSLTDSGAIMKGGKTGKLFVAGSPEMSLMLERIHLPVNHRRHMPPLGNPQLTEQETQLLYWWINSGAPFRKKLIELSPDDTLRKMSAGIFDPGHETEEEFSFTSADPEVVQSLNNKNRSVSLLSKSSPALEVRIFNKAAYNKGLLEELNVVKDQVVSLNLDRLPVKDDDMQAILMFKNLRRLSLNFTLVTARIVAQLAKLENLQSLSLSGTKLDVRDLSSTIKNAVGIKTIYLWNSGIDTDGIKLLRKNFPSITWNEGYVDDGSKVLQLNKVKIDNATQVFSDSIQIRLNHFIKGVEIRYTVDGTEPDSIRSPVFKEQHWCHKNTIVRARAFKKGWSKSEVSEFSFFQGKIIPDSIAMEGPLHYKFPGMGKETFFDRRLGGLSPFGDKWAGIAEKPVTLTLFFSKEKDISSLMFQFLILPAMNADIPYQIEISGGESENDCQLMARNTLKAVENREVKIDQVTTVFKTKRVKVLRIKVIPRKGKAGNNNMLSLIDEMFLN